MKTVQRMRTIEDQLSMLVQPSQIPPSPMSHLSNRLATMSIYNTPSLPRYTECQSLPITPNNVMSNNPNPYVPPHRCETPRPMTPPRQLPTPAASNPFMDNTTTPHPNVTFN